MKRYYNETKDKWYTEGRIITWRLPKGVFSGIPTEKQLLSWGFVEYVSPVHERTLDDAKRERIDELMDYDSSSAVNEFYLNGQGMWIAPDERSNYMLTLQGAQRMGITDITFLGQTIPVATAIQMIDAVNLYAMQCVGVTESHKAAINALTTIADVDAYDYTVGYPQKITF